MVVVVVVVVWCCACVCMGSAEWRMESKAAARDESSDSRGQPVTCQQQRTLLLCLLCLPCRPPSAIHPSTLPCLFRLSCGSDFSALSETLTLGAGRSNSGRRWRRQRPASRLGLVSCRFCSLSPLASSRMFNAQRGLAGSEERACARVCGDGGGGGVLRRAVHACVRVGGHRFPASHPVQPSRGS